jgi:hypothetical protein
VSESKDWRLQGQERYLKSATLVHRLYRPYPGKPEWDHDHCEFCWAKLAAEGGDGAQATGFCTVDEYHWICERCVADFTGLFDWTLAGRGQLSERRAIELHDSQLAGVIASGDDAVVQFRPAYVHSSLGTPGDDEGSGWVEPIDLVIRQAADGVDATATGDVWDGTLVVAERRFQNLIPLPLDRTSATELAIELTNGRTITIRGTGVVVQSAGAATLLRAFPGSKTRSG